MIANEQEFRATRAAVERLENALSHADDRRAARDPRLQQALRDGVEGELQLLREQLAEYEARAARGETTPTARVGSGGEPERRR
jgi:hypothetical protein